MLSDCPHLRTDVEGARALTESSCCADRQCAWWDPRIGCACLGILPAAAPPREERAPLKVPA